MRRGTRRDKEHRASFGRSALRDPHKVIDHSLHALLELGMSAFYIHLRDTLEVLPVRASSADEFKDFMTRLNQPVRIMSGEELSETIATNLEAYKAVAKEMGMSQ